MHILGFHFIFSAYGFWLPNDPRGSWSTTVREYELAAFGPATKVDTTRSVAAARHNRRLRLKAKQSLRHPPVHFTGLQARAVGRGFARAMGEADYIIHALAILPDHAHVVMAWHARPVEQIAAHLKAKATRQLTDENLHPFDGAPKPISPWARGYWCPFIKTPEHMNQVIRYVGQNPVKAGLPPQHWKFVTPFEHGTRRSRGAS